MTTPPNTAENMYAPPPGPDKGKLLVIVGAVLLLAALATGAWWGTRGGKGKGDLDGAATRASLEEWKKESEAPGSATAGALPANFPRDVPALPKSTVGLATTPAGKARDGMVELSTTMTPAEVVKFYQDELVKGAGWRRTRMDEGDGDATMEFRKDARTVTIRASSGKVVINYRSASSMDLDE